MSRTVVFAAILSALAVGCHRTPSPDPAFARADRAATRFATELRGRLQAAMREGGPTRAVAVCGTEARALAERVHSETGVRVGRASLRTRNPANVAPAWVGEWLHAQGERPAEGVVGVRAVAGSDVHVLRPIAVEAVCVTCHGDPAGMAPPLVAALRDAYPGDRATGYRPGDLRGALWVEAAITP
ncbi:MAG: DUF3365 domain-containing protein [Polyangiales bacterium]